MRKRSKYRPKGVIVDAMTYIKGSMTPVAENASYLVDLKIKTHGAMTALTTGCAVRADIDTLITMSNICEALYRMGFGREYDEVVRHGADAIYTVGSRGATAGRFILRAGEMAALNDLMDLHDALLDVITIRDMENAIKMVDEEYRLRKTRPIITKEETA